MMKQSDLIKLILEHDDRLSRIEELLLGEARASLTLPEPKKATQAPEPKTKKPRKKKAPAPIEVDFGKVYEMSDSELVIICKDMGNKGASRQMLREDLLAYVLGDSIQMDDPLSDIREKTFAYIRGNATMVKSVQKCSLDCPTCPSNTVVECWSVNSDLIEKEI